jgi:hypothetical protein
MSLQTGLALDWPCGWSDVSNHIWFPYPQTGASACDLNPTEKAAPLHRSNGLPVKIDESNSGVIQITRVLPHWAL